MIDKDRQSIFHKMLLSVLVVYGFYVLLAFSRDKNNIIEKLKKAVLKTKLVEYIFLFICLFMLTGDYLLNDNLTEREKRDIYHIIHLSIIVTLTALFAHLDMFVIPAMIGIGLWVISA